mgnify:CR=1 FL=1
MISRITSKHYIPIVEKTNWFKSIDTFSDIGENIIANLINSMDDLFFNKGEYIIDSYHVIDAPVFSDHLPIISDIIYR